MPAGLGTQVEDRTQDRSLRLYRPAGAEGASPALVVTGSWLTVKEQRAGLYAHRLAEQGFPALAFDFTGFGQSLGGPRDAENPSRKARDIHAAVTFLAGLDNIDANRIGGQPGPKQLTWIAGGQLDFYDQPAQVDPAVAAMTTHFAASL